MTSCEKCWRDAHSSSERYNELIKQRNCTPEERAGEDARICPKCGLRAIHQFCGVCMNCGEG